MDSMVFGYLLDLIHNLNSRLLSLENANPNWEANRFDKLLDNVVDEYQRSLK